MYILVIVLTVVIIIFIFRRRSIFWCCYKKEWKLIRDIWKKFPNSDNSKSLSTFEKFFMTIFQFFRCFSLVNFRCLWKDKEIQSIITSLYVVGWLGILIIFLIIYSSSISWLKWFVIYRLVDLVNYILCIIFVDSYKEGWRPRSINRTLLLSMLNYCEIILAFAFLYLVTNSIAYSDCSNIIQNPWETIYFSAITITTLGYGDIIPISSLGQKMALFEPLLGFLIIVLFIGKLFAWVSNERKRIKTYRTRYSYKKIERIVLSRRYRRWQRR